MTTITFDTLEYAKKLENAGFTREQAEVQADALKKFALEMDEKTRQELATKGDVRECELRLLKEIEKVRKEIEEVRAELKTDIQKVKYDLLVWQIGGFIALAGIMAKGFGWIGF